MFHFRGKHKCQGPSRAALPEPFLPGLCCPSCGAHSPHCQGWSAVSHTCPTKDGNYTTLALWGGTASQEWRKQIPEWIYRKSQQELEVLLLSVVFTNPMESLQFYLCLPFLGGILLLCSPDTKLLTCQRKQAMPVIKGNKKPTNLTNIFVLASNTKTNETREGILAVWAKWALIQ